MSKCGRCVGSCKCGLKLPVGGVTYKGDNDNYMPSGSHKCEKCKGYYIGTCACAPEKPAKPEKPETTSKTSSKMTRRKSMHYRKPRSRSPSKKKCKSNCNCATCKTEKARQEYEKRYRDASTERKRRSPRNKKSPRKRI